jgi:hypothetical protein
MKFKNIEIEQMIAKLKPLLPHRDRIGYIAARNTRILSDALTEYFEFKNRLIEKYGEKDKDADGNELQTVSLKFDSPNFKEFQKEFNPIADVEQDIQIMTLKYNDIIGLISGTEILELSWMFED